VTAFEAGRRAEALSLLDQALSLDPDDAEASLTRGVVLEALGRVPEALASYEAAVVSAGRRKDFPPHVLADAKESAARLKKR
ncbi:MAG: tetratricopeptide repeat protein, partial [Elusimicrobia bacterium]|nr:tetratricopeptide repeat protein [Elusimicrobiota bacterium]